MNIAANSQPSRRAVMAWSGVSVIGGLGLSVGLTVLQAFARRHGSVDIVSSVWQWLTFHWIAAFAIYSIGLISCALMAQVSVLRLLAVIGGATVASNLTAAFLFALPLHGGPWDWVAFEGVFIYAVFIWGNFFVQLVTPLLLLIMRPLRRAILGAHPVLVIPRYSQADADAAAEDFGIH